MSDLYSIQCENCGSTRPDDLASPCPKCQSKNTKFLGYVYGYEARAFIKALFSVVGFVALLIVFGALYLYYTNAILGI